MSETPVIVTVGNPSTCLVKACIIWMHGLGADGNDFAPIVSQLGLPDSLCADFIFPHAPEIPITINAGAVMRAWYDIRDISNLERDIDEAGMERSCETIIGIAHQQAELVGWDKLVLAGFSQGAAMAAQLVEYLPQACGGLLCLSAYAPRQLRPKSAVSGMPALIMHGEFDPIVPIALGAGLADNLKNAGLDVGYTTYPMAHQVCQPQIAAIGQWLTQILHPSSN